MIWQVILFVTSRCNLRCSSCFYKDSLNLDDDLSLEELTILIRKLPKLNNIIVTGGEPTLREDLPEILDEIRRHQPDLEIHLNTNGSFPDRVERIATEHLQKGGRLGVNVSLDGDRETHEIMRGRPVHDRTMDTLRRLTELKKRHGFYFTINSLLAPETIAGMDELLTINRSGISLDFHNIEIRRQDGERAAHIPDEDLKAFYRRYLDYIRTDYPEHYEINRARFELQYANHTTGRSWGYPCNAGQKAVVVYHDGTLAPCEMLDPVLNMRDFDFDLEAALASPAMAGRVRQIRDTGCSCTHGCWLITSMFEHLTSTCGKLDFTRIPENHEHRSLVPADESANQGSDA